MRFESTLYFRNWLLKGDNPTRVMWDGDRRQIRLGSVLLLISAVVYGLTHVISFLNIPASLSIYLVEPFLWLLLALAAFVVWRTRLARWFHGNTQILILSLLLGVCQVVLLLAAGFLFGFGASPYSHKLLPLLGNSVYLFSRLVALELTRACVVHSWGKRQPVLALVISTIWFSFLALPRASLVPLNNLGVFLQFSATTLLPIIAANVLASQLVWSGGFLSSLTYLGILYGWEWYSPILPDLVWMATAFIGTMVPVLGIIMVQDVVAPRGERTEADAQGDSSSTIWLLVAGFAVLIFYFNSGFLGVRPTVISGVSMRPLFKAGDVVVSRAVPLESLQVGDIIVFRLGDHRVVHRIIAIREENGEIWFTTQGDNNHKADAPVHSSQVEGRVILLIPKAGWVSILFREVLDRLS